jgi:hypothetical protein
VRRVARRASFPSSDDRRMRRLEVDRFRATAFHRSVETGRDQMLKPSERARSREADRSDPENDVERGHATLPASVVASSDASVVRARHCRRRGRRRARVERRRARRRRTQERRARAAREATPRARGERRATPARRARGRVVDPSVG